MWKSSGRLVADATSASQAASLSWHRQGARSSAIQAEDRPLGRGLSFGYSPQRSMEFLPKNELLRRFGAARRARVRELMAMGIPQANAKTQASSEFGVYDRFLVDERGWMLIEGLELPAGETSSKRPPARSRRARSQLTRAMGKDTKS